MKSFYCQFMRDEAGATAIEYGLIAGGITLAIIGTIHTLSETIKTTLFELVAAATTN